ncbi:MAG: hypothetical protein BroJett029_36790 [Alphaproteobacteria bacterium]|nr:MAG: hypothetical protein BroJett029_36790 [Alphaproteobacteria bacterium]
MTVTMPKRGQAPADRAAPFRRAELAKVLTAVMVPVAAARNQGYAGVANDRLSPRVSAAGRRDTGESHEGAP